MTIHSKRKYSKEVIEKMKPKDTSKHPWRKANSQLEKYTLKTMAEKKKRYAE